MCSGGVAFSIVCVDWCVDLRLIMVEIVVVCMGKVGTTVCMDTATDSIMVDFRPVQRVEVDGSTEGGTRGFDCDESGGLTVRQGTAVLASVSCDGDAVIYRGVGCSSFSVLYFTTGAGGRLVGGG